MHELVVQNFESDAWEGAFKVGRTNKDYATIRDEVQMCPTWDNMQNAEMAANYDGSLYESDMGVVISTCEYAQTDTAISEVMKRANGGVDV